MHQPLICRYCYLYGMLLAAVCATTAGATTWTVLDRPGAENTYATGYDGSTVVGSWYSGSPSGGPFGFEFDGANWQNRQYPGSVWTQLTAVDGSRRVGAYYNGAGVHGALLDGETWQTLDYPGSNQTIIQGIDGSMVVGLYGPLGASQGFIYDGASWTSLNYPGARSTTARGISGTKIVGQYQDPSAQFHSFLRNGTAWTEIAYPGADWTNAFDVDGANIVGSYFKDEAFHGYVFDGSNWTTLDFPTAQYTEVYSIAGDKVVGFYTEESGAQRGFIATVSTLDTYASVGDFNEDHVVNAADYVLWRKGLSSTNLPQEYDAWRAHFGQLVSIDSDFARRAIGTIPEPATLLLIGFAVPVLYFRRARTSQFFNCRLVTRSAIVGALLFLTLHHRQSVAITINMAYSDEGNPAPHEENPSWDPAGVFLKSHFQRAKQIWESLLPGPGSYNIIFTWDSDVDSVRLGQTSNQPLISFVEINPNQPWFVDLTPTDDSEFAFANRPDGMQVRYHQRTYGQLSSTDQSTYFPGSAPPSALETMYRGFGSSAVPSESGQSGINAATGYDLLTTIVHEMGHVLGIAGIEPGEYNIDPQHVGGITDVLVLEGEGGHLAGNNNVPGFLICDMCGEIGVRRLPTATDVLVIAEDQGISDVHLARVGRTSSGIWTDSTAWLTDDVPDSSQGAYITGVGPVTLDVDAQLTTLGVNDGSSLNVQSHQLKVEGGLTLDGGSIAVSTGGLVTAYNIIADPAAVSTQAGSLVRFNTFSPGFSTATSATFNGRVAIGHRPDSAGPAIIRSTFDPSSIKTWTIAEELAVGDASAVESTLVIDAASKFTSATGRIGNNGVSAGTGIVNIRGAGSSWTINGPLNAQQGSLNISDHGTFTTGPVTMGASVGQMSATVDGGTWSINGNLEVGPSVTSGLGFGKVTVLDGHMSVTGNVNVHGTSSIKSEVIVEVSPLLTGDFNIGQFGRVTYRAGATALEETFKNLGATQSGAVGGETVFRGAAFAPLSTFDNFAGTVAGAGGGTVEFTENSRASDALIVNAGPMVSLGFGGRTRFSGSATASNATITNQVSTLGIGAQATPAATDFYDNSTAGEATIINKSGTSVIGVTTFHDSSTAGMANFYNETSTPSGSSGTFVFKDSSSADEGKFYNGPLGGNIIFNDNSTAGIAKIYMRGKTNSTVQFNNQSSAGTAQIDVGPATPTQFNEFSQAQFLTNSTAAHSTITVRGGGGSVSFFGTGGPTAVPTCTAENATIDVFGATSTANAAGTATFSSASTAGNSNVTAYGSTVTGAAGAVINVSNGGHAGSATLTANGGSTSTNGATIRFQQGGFGDTARLIVNSGAGADFTQNGSGGTSVGSIEGAGAFSLGGTPLTVGNLGTNTTVSGNITDSGFGSFLTGGRLNKVGIGQLILAGTNTYSGLTTVENGTLVVNGTIDGAAVVKSGAVLKGTGALKNVSVETGGVFAPGTSPGAITVSGLTLMSGSTLEYELGAMRDRIVVTGDGNVVLGGILNLSFLDGYTPEIGQAFSLFEGSIGNITGTFSAVNAPTVDGRPLSLAYGTNQVMLQVGLAGDFSDNGVVDTADYVVWRKNPAGTYTQDDYNTWRTNFGQAEGSRAALSSAEQPSAAVPEPLTALVLFTAMTVAGMQRRRAV